MSYISGAAASFFRNSPWNLPLAIFAGHLLTALVAGHTVIAKSAEQASLVTYRAAHP